MGQLFLEARFGRYGSTTYFSAGSKWVLLHESLFLRDR